MKFIELNIQQRLKDAVRDLNYQEATEIQEKVIPEIMLGKDICAISQTGSGKTLAFTLPVLEKLMNNYEADKKIKVLILSPTRELALQTRDNIRKCGKYTNYKTSVILGGVNKESQQKIIKNGIDILVATPGRLVDLTKNNKVDISNVNTLILDEADTMLDMGFIKDIKYLIDKVPEDRQTMMFSATMPEEIKKLTQEVLKNPANIKTNNINPPQEITQLAYIVNKDEKLGILLKILKEKEKLKNIVFVRSKESANKLEKELKENQVEINVIHGNKTQLERIKTMRNFRENKVNILIATDIAARGLDIDSLETVINYDIPESSDVYIHRIGRTARNGKKGTSIIICTISETKKLLEIENKINSKIKIIKTKIRENKPNEGLTKFKPIHKHNKVNKNKGKMNFNKKNLK